MKPERAQLIWIPIIHTQTDLGSMASAVRRLHIQRAGRAAWEQHRKAIDSSWVAIRHYAGGLDLPWDRVYLFQDGLPHCGYEREIVESLAQAGSQNHQLLLDLVARGATLVGTESPDLLREEYELARHSLTSTRGGSPDPSGRRQERGRALLHERDAYIAARINERLAPGDTGILFLGKLHTLPTIRPDVDVRQWTAPLPTTEVRGPEPPTPRNVGGETRG